MQDSLVITWQNFPTYLPVAVRHRSSSATLVLFVFANPAGSCSNARTVPYGNKVGKGALFVKSLFNIHTEQRSAAGGASMQTATKWETALRTWTVCCNSVFIIVAVKPKDSFVFTPADSVYQFCSHRIFSLCYHLSQGIRRFLSILFPTEMGTEGSKTYLSVS